jgi:inner membrane protein YidH
MSEPEVEVADATRRTRLAAERTWLAWWRSGIASATAALAVGGLVPELVDDAGWPYVVLGTGYALVAVVLFVAATLRKRAVDRALDQGHFAPLPLAWAVVLSVAGGCLAVGTLLVIAFA